MKAIHYVVYNDRRYKSIHQYLLFPEFKVRYNMNYNSNNSGIKICRDLFEDRYNKVWENINSSEITLQFPIESITCPGKCSYEIMSIYKNEGPLHWDEVKNYIDSGEESVVPAFRFPSLKYLKTNLPQLLKDSELFTWFESSDLSITSIFGNIISRNEVDFPGVTPEIFLEILMNPETTPNFGVYLEMKLLKRFNLI